MLDLSKLSPAHQNLFDQLASIGYPKEQAFANAMLWQARAESGIARWNRENPDQPMSMEDWLQRYPLTVTSSIPQSLPSRTLHQFAGPEAKTADSSSLSQAIALERKGRSPEQILAETGWFRGLDRHWRFEIDDSQARLRGYDHEKDEPEITSTNPEVYQTWMDEAAESPRGVALALVLDHPKLFAAYPMLQYVRVKIAQRRRDGACLTEDPLLGGFTIEIADPYSYPAGEALKSVMHEVQHVIQAVEGFARGGSMDDLSLPTGHEIGLAINAEYRRRAEEIESSAEYADLVDRALASLSDSEWVHPRTGERDERVARRRAENMIYEESGLDALESERLARVDRALTHVGALGQGLDSRFAGYRHLAGEAEARNAAARIGMSDAERREIAPWATLDIDPRDALIRMREERRAAQADEPLRAGGTDWPLIEALAAFQQLPDARQFDEYERREALLDQLAELYQSSPWFKGVFLPVAHGWVSVTGSAKEAGLWQVTAFDAQMKPMSDTGSKALGAALREALSEARFDLLAKGVAPESEPVDLTLSRSRVRDAAGALLKVYHGTAEVVFIPGDSVPGDPEAIAELKAMAARFGIADYTSVNAVLERLGRSGQRGRLGETDVDAVRAAELHEKGKTRMEPSRNALGFDAFRMPAGDIELGAHFGTRDQALSFGEPFEFYLDLRNPVRLSDLGSWHYQKVIAALREAGVSISETEAAQVDRAEDHNEALRALMLAKGYDGVVYANEAEGAGDSYIALKPESIFRAEQVVLPQMRVMNNPAFRSWFGDSLATVDGESGGVPRVLYHGTDADIDVFYGREVTAWVSEDPALASGYALERRSGLDEDESAPNVVPVYASVRNPLTLDVDMNDPAKMLRPVLERLGLLAELRLIYDHADSVWEVVNNSLFMRATKKLGYDGVRVRERGAWTWGVDGASQLKSIFNSGDFSPESEHILSQSAVAAAAPAFARWFGDSPVVTPGGAPQVMYHGSKTPDGLTVFVPGGRDPAAQSGDMLGVASYFTSDPEEASAYAGEQGAVLPVYLSGRLLNLEAPLLPDAEAMRLTAFAERVLLPADRARFSSLRKARFFSEAEIEEAKAFFEQERARWKDVDGVMERSKPEVDKQGDLFLVRYTDFEAPVLIRTSDDAEALFRSVGWGNLPALGYDGVMLTNSEGRRWVAMHRPEGSVKSAIGNGGQYNRYSPRILDQSAYHGSVAEFERFDPTIGGGVGRSYGFGIYLTADRGVADRYRSAMARQRGWVGPVAAAIAGRFAEDYPDAVRVEGYNAEMLAEAGGALVRLVESYADQAFLAWADELAPAGRVYTAEIPPTDELLSWDLPVSEQPAAIREVLYAHSLHTVPLQPGFGMGGEFARDGEPTGADIYAYLEQAYNSAEKASQVLGRLGIKGLTYRHMSFGSRDYVVFSPDDAKIVRPAVESAAFRDWFSGSVLTESGEAGGMPMVFYHGTRPGVDFDVFQPNAGGIYFTPDPLYAEGYTNPLFDRDPERADGPGVAGQIMPVYLRSERPYVVEAEPGSDEWENFVYRGLDCAALAGRGYDAAVLKVAGTGEIDQVIVFQVEQIKSALGNRGSFDREDPSFLNQSPAPTEDLVDQQTLRDGNPRPVTGQPVTYYYAKNLEKAPNMGALYGQDIEPAGDYLVVSSRPIEGGENWEVGSISFSNPLVLDAEGGTVAWKKALSVSMGGKKGKALSDAVRAQGYDSIITFDKYGLSETISLGPKRVPGKELQDELVLVMSPEFQSWFKGSAVADGGRPKKVYHGISHPDSDAPAIEAFDRLYMVKQGRRRAGQDAVGVWFTETLGNRGVEMYSGGGRIESGVIYPVYLSIKKPWAVSFMGMRRVANRLLGREREAKLDGEAVEALRAWMKENDIDGIQLLHDPRDGDEFAAQQVWIALEPEQIRTAITSDVRYVPASQLERAPVQALDAFIDRAISTPAFRDWFAESKATVDGQPGSRPLVLFHGTQADVDAFDPERQGETVDSGDVGFFFTNFAKEASLYASADWWREDPQPNVMPVFLSLQNPKVLTCDPFEGPGLWYDNHGQEEARKAMEEGYDGLIVRSTQPSMVMPNGEQIAMYVAFEPTQIKSALGNVGAYDRNDSRVLFQSAAPAVWVNPVQMEAWTKKAGLSPAAVEAIAKIGIGQRGKPERLMVEAQMVMGGGVLQYAIEHVGDLTDRMGPRHGLEWGYEETVEKASTCLRKLRSAYGFGREHAENLVSNARFRGVSVERHAVEVNEALERYAAAHAELEAPTRIHALARDAAVQLGRQDFSGAAEKLEALLEAIPTFEAYLRELSGENDPGIGVPASPEVSKDWFADSKVVDEAGQPLLVYHGTDAEFDEFSPGEEGIFFAVSRDVAEFYAREQSGGSSGYVVSAYLSVSNPLIMTWREYLNGVTRDGVNHYLLGNDGLAELGYDGLRLVEPESDDPAMASETYVAFRPDQVRVVRDARRPASEAPRVLAQSAAPARAPRGVLRVDEHGKNIVWEQGAYAIAVDNPQDAGYVNLWHEGKRVGAMSLGRGRNSGTRGYKTVASVEVEKGHRGRGLGKQMYRVALEFVGEQYRGIGGEHEQRSNSRQVPAIYRALGGRELESGDLVIDRAEPLPGLALESERRAENFRRWFGDSKIVDVAGVPKVMYHKTYADFTVFDRERVGENDYGYAGAGFYFMPVPLQGFTYGDRTMPVYLSIQNPYVRTVSSWNTDPLDPYQWIPANSAKFGGDKKAASRAWTSMIREMGYDGFVDATTPDGEVVAFDNTQIKSAVGNNGDFDPSNPSILAQSPVLERSSAPSSFALQMRAVRAWMGRSVITENGAAGGEPLRVYHGSHVRGITEFEGGKTAYGIFFTPDPLTAGYYAVGDDAQVYEAYLNVERLADFDDAEVFERVMREAIDFTETRDVDDVRAFAARLYREGFGKSEPVTRFFTEQDGFSSVDGVDYTVEDLLRDNRIDASEIDDLVVEIASEKVTAAYDEAAPTSSEELNAAREAYGSQQFYMEYQDDFMRAARALGYDGVVFSDPSSTGASVSYVVFESSQVMLAPEVPGAAPALSAVSLDQSAWHGSPYQFEAFELDKVGSSEGAAAYGWGVYFASQREVALWYSGALGLSGSPVPQLFTIRGIPTVRGTPEQKAADLVHGLGLSKAKKLARQWVKEARNTQEEGGRGLEYYEGVLSVLEGLTSARDVRRASGNVLRADIPEVDQLLDWDAPLTSQPAVVLRAVERLSAQYDLPTAASGGLWYKALARAAGSDKQASFCLCAEGVPGISYLDGASRGVTGGTRNFVIFDDARISVLDRERVAILGQFAGEKAVGADLLALKLARKLARKGQADADVLAETGWFRGVDGQWRFELDASQAALRPEMVALLREGDDPIDVARVAVHVSADGLWTFSMLAKNGASRLVSRVPEPMVSLLLPQEVIAAVKKGQGSPVELAVGDQFLSAVAVDASYRFSGVESLPLPLALDYPALFDAYPMLRGGSMSLIEGVRSMTSGEGDILIGRDLHPSKFLPVALHELQHVIQTLEGFAPGGSPEMAFSSPAVNPLATRGGLRAAKAILGEKLAEMARPSTLEEYARDAWRIPEGQVIPDDVQAAYAEYVEGVSRAAASGAFNQAAQQAAAREWYRRLAGEMESRLVERRWRLSAEERRALLPGDGFDVDPKDAIVLRYSASAACVADHVATASRLGALIDDYLRVDTGLSAWFKQSVVDSASWSKGECEKVSVDLAAWLREQGCDARVVFAQGLRGGLDAGAAADWGQFRDRGGLAEHFWHAVVLCDGIVADLSGAQFGSRYAGVRLLTADDFHAEWDSVRVSREGRSVDLRRLAGGATPQRLSDAQLSVGAGGLARVHGLISRGALPGVALREVVASLQDEGHAAEADDLRMLGAESLRSFGWSRRGAAAGEIISLTSLVSECGGALGVLVDELAQWKPARYGLPAVRGGMLVSDLVRGMLARLQDVHGVDRDGALGMVIESFQEAGILALDVQMGGRRVRLDLDFAADSFKQALAAEEAPRAQIALGENLSFDIRLLAMSDSSSFAHETGHAFLEILRDQARLTTAEDSQIRSDWQAVVRWLNLQSLRDDQAIPVEAHERFARGFELYLRRGVAPSSELEGVFKLLADLLRQIYETIRSLFVSLPADVEEVFGRMLSDQPDQAQPESFDPYP